MNTNLPDGESGPFQTSIECCCLKISIGNQQRRAVGIVKMVFLFFICIEILLLFCATFMYMEESKHWNYAKCLLQNCTEEWNADEVYSRFEVRSILILRLSNGSIYARESRSTCEQLYEVCSQNFTRCCFDDRKPINDTLAFDEDSQIMRWALVLYAVVYFNLFLAVSFVCSFYLSA